MPIKLKLLYPLSYLASTPKGDNRVEEQEMEKLLLVNFKSWWLICKVNFKLSTRSTKRYPLWEVLVLDLGLKIKKNV